MLQTMTSKKLIASAIIFLFSNYSVPVIAQSADELQGPQVSQESVVQSVAPSVSVSSPRIVVLDQTQNQLFAGGDKIAIQSVNFSSDLMNTLNSCMFAFNENKVPLVKGAYTNDKAGYVCLSGVNLQTGLLQIQRAQNALEQRAGSLLSKPANYDVRPDIVNIQLSPKIITDSASHSKLIAMDAWDFRLETAPAYTQVALAEMFLTAFASFKAYVQMLQKEHLPTSIHTGFWGIDYLNNPRVTTVLQMIAAEVAGVDKLIIHTGPSDQDNQIVSDAKKFLQAQDGKPMQVILQELLQNIEQQNWQAGII